MTQVSPGRRACRYTVTSAQIVATEDVRALNAPQVRPTLALVGCTPYWVDTQRDVVIAQIETRERDLMDESTRSRHGGARHAADTTLQAEWPRQRMVPPSPVACMRGVPPDLVDAVPRLATLLQAL